MSFFIPFNFNQNVNFQDTLATFVNHQATYFEFSRRYLEFCFPKQITLKVFDSITDLDLDFKSVHFIIQSNFFRNFVVI